MNAFALAPKQQELVEEVRSLARDKLVPLARAGRPGRVNRPLVKALGDLGLLQRLFPSSVGGSQPGTVSAMELCLVREALARECTEAETALALQGLGSYPILLSGGPEAIKRWLPAVVRGEALPAFALTEPEAGSDAGALAMRAKPDGEGWRLTGVKTYISNAPEADVYTIFARTTEAAGPKGITAFVLPGDAGGVSGSPLELLAPHPIGRLELDGAFVPPGHVLGKVDGGFRVAMQTLDLFRPSVGALAVGIAQAALDAALAHAGSRLAFGGPLRNLQAVAHLLAEMATRIEAARMLVYAAASAHDTGEDRITQRSAMAKLFATETAQFVVDAAIQIHGARALERGHLLEHLYREVRAPRIYEGASEVQRSVIARELYREAGDG